MFRKFKYEKQAKIKKIKLKQKRIKFKKKEVYCEIKKEMEYEKTFIN